MHNIIINYNVLLSPLSKSKFHCNCDSSKSNASIENGYMPTAICIAFYNSLGMLLSC